MIPTRYHRATDVDDAVAAIASDPDARFLAGGTNLVDHMKLGIAAPSLLVDVTRLPLDTITPTDDGGVRVGATVRNSDLAADPVVRQDYPILARALLAGASPQLRNLATTAGNLLQRTRCVYFQDPSTPCNKREPGTGCSADGGFTRYHAVLGSSPACYATHPSDMAVALAALDAQVIVVGPDGEERIPAAHFHRLPGDAPEADTVLPHDRLIVAVELPPPVAGTAGTYRKVRDRASYAFALVSVAAEVVATPESITHARIAIGGVAHKPWRATLAERVLLRDGAGTPSVELFREAAEAEFVAAEPMQGNEFKVPLAVRTLTAVLRDLTGATS
ncbi:xanthine dehydrogenase family protein subunit M [Rhodococcus sp. HNM0569]|uniref:FAD binding domain-containing protein n=1 Tax=Rhodococcus sp. HNM0569 TaxID=2716340 RepID=UPI00146E63EE|nr:xanthine dehydrogenase family protein subunit M [Rhodococcus sp. HNM0569]NLU83286.1 xanthine dehydrogenase family protein subunit M [Rhodococcus sp. HNM0569]